MSEPIPCPCCGESGRPRADDSRPLGLAGLHTGAQGDGSMGVHCYGCNLLMRVHLPDNWPADIKPGDMRALQLKMLAEAVAKWNRRARPAKCENGTEVELIGRDIERGCKAWRCTCGGYAGRATCTEEECRLYGCGRDVPGSECCAVAFVCGLCGKRYVGAREAPEMEDF
jgi:hypothetical protein